MGGGGRAEREVVEWRGTTKGMFIVFVLSCLTCLLSLLSLLSCLSVVTCLALLLQHY